jgi:DNA-binding response OmpR family regulator
MAEAIRRRILLVDDDLPVLLSLKAVLELSGFEVDSASSAAQARSRLQIFQYHMVITDMKMEDAQAGFQVIKSARQSGYDPAIAILTAHPIDGSQWKEEGAHCMLVKPVETDILLRQIEAILVQHEDRKQQRVSSSAVKSCLASNEATNWRM